MGKIIEIKQENAFKAYSEGCSDVKKVLENLLGTENVREPNVLDNITRIEDVFKELGESYNDFLTTHKNLDESTLNYLLLAKGIAYLNNGWKWDYTGTFWANWWDVRGSGFVLIGSTYDSDRYTTVGAALRCKNKEVAQHAAKVFLPQYKGHYKPSAA